MVIHVPDDPQCLQIGDLLRGLAWWMSCNSRAMLIACTSSFRTSEVNLSLPCSAGMCSRLFVWLSVMWIISSSGSQAIAAQVAVTRVRELVRGLPRWIWTNWNSLSSPLEMARVIHQVRHSTTPNQRDVRLLSDFTSHRALSDQPWQQ